MPLATGGPLNSYASYLRLVYAGRWVDTRIAARLCEEVQNFVLTPTSEPYEILVISMPPQHGKSMAITEALPSWYLCRNPTHNVIEISYNETFAALFGRRNREKLLRYGPALGVTLAKSPRTSREFELEEGGGMLSCGVLSGITGHPCNLMIIDDPIKNRKDADSKNKRERLVEEWQNTFKTRLAVGAKVIVIQTRWHEDDLAGHILRSEANVRALNFPCEAQENDLLGRSPGAPLLPELGKGERWLKSYKKSYLASNGARAWNALFQGRPAPDDGNLLKRGWWQFYPWGSPPQVNTVLISVDASFKETNTSDFVAIQVWGKRGVQCFLLDETHERMGFTKTLAAIRRVKRSFPNATILVEDAANGSAIIDVLRTEFFGVLPVKARDSKASRVNAVSPMIEAGNVFLPHGAPFTGAFIEECAAFPNAQHDDRVDAMSQALNYLLSTYARDPLNKDMSHLPKELRPLKTNSTFMKWD